MAAGGNVPAVTINFVDGGDYDEEAECGQKWIRESVCRKCGANATEEYPWDNYHTHDEEGAGIDKCSTCSPDGLVMYKYSVRKPFCMACKKVVDEGTCYISREGFIYHSACAPVPAWTASEAAAAAAAAATTDEHSADAEDEDDPKGEVDDDDITTATAAVSAAEANVEHTRIAVGAAKDVLNKLNAQRCVQAMLKATDVQTQREAAQMMSKGTGIHLNYLDFFVEAGAMAVLGTALRTWEDEQANVDCAKSVINLAAMHKYRLSWQDQLIAEGILEPLVALLPDHPVGRGGSAAAGALFYLTEDNSDALQQLSGIPGVVEALSQAPLQAENEVLKWLRALPATGRVTKRARPS